MRDSMGVRAGAMAGAALAFVLACGPALAAAPIVTRVDTDGDVGWYSSLQLDGPNVVASYYDNTRHQLKLATCTAGCTSANPAWVTSTVDAAVNVGWYTSLQLSNGNPVIAYYDFGNGALKLATCTAACATQGATWVIAVVDRTSSDVGRFPSLQMDNGNPVIAYRDKANGVLKLATCTAGCATAAPAWVIVTVDGAAPIDVGRFVEMQLDGGKPVLEYLDHSNGKLKVARCTAGCSSAAPSWVFSVVDTVVGDDEMQFSLQLNGGDPVVSYHDPAAGSLKLATCVAACATAAPQWIVTTVDDANAGDYSSLQLDAGRPVVSYLGTIHNCFTTGAATSCHTAIDLRLATCTAGCASASPTWVISTVDNSGLAGYDPSMKLAGGMALVSYQDFLQADFKVAVVDLAEAAAPSNYTGLWWNFDESGWGINFAHQGDIVFGTLFTYDASGQPMWLVLASGAKTAGSTFAGTLYRTTGPAFDARPFTPIGPANVVDVGSMTVTFSGDSASLAYTVDGAEVRKTIRKQVFAGHAAFCHPATGGRRALANYQDLWWNANESGWGVNLTHQGDLVFATLFTYDASGKGMWLVATAAKQADGSFAGDLVRTTGPAFNAVPFNPIGPANVTSVGTLRLSFSDGTTGTLAYSVAGVSVAKAITRQEFSSPMPACSY